VPFARKKVSRKGTAKINFIFFNPSYIFATLREKKRFHAKTQRRKGTAKINFIFFTHPTSLRLCDFARKKKVSRKDAKTQRNSQNKFHFFYPSYIFATLRLCEKKIKKIARKGAKTPLI